MFQLCETLKMSSLVTIAPYRRVSQLHLCNRVIFSLSHRSSTIWSAFMGKSSSPRSHLWFPYMGLGRWRQLRHRQPLAPLVSYHPFLLLTRMGLRAHKLPLASMCVFSFDLHIFKYWLIFIEQTARNLGVSTSVSALEISDLPPVSVPTASVYRVQHILNNHLITAID